MSRLVGSGGFSAAGSSSLRRRCPTEYIGKYIRTGAFPRIQPVTDGDKDII